MHPLIYVPRRSLVIPDRACRARLGCGCGTSKSGSPSPWTPAALGAIVAGWWESDYGITLNGGNVDSWADKSGNSRTLSAAGAAQPLWVASGSSGVLRFNGSSHTMATGAFVLNQPEHVFIAAVVPAGAVGNRYMLDGVSLNKGAIFTTNKSIVNVYAGAQLQLDGYATSGAGVIIDAVFNGVSSKLGANGLAHKVGNAGAGNMGGLCIGSAAGLNFAPLDVISVAVCSAELSADRAKMVSYMRAKAASAGVVIP